ncbi:6-phosphogluconolactonase [Phytophthora citrophthora]|uniref:6-phosphogluconolactonase n=1 Tax=Phytophthora citrophthora TaxID=4793 RepID=A0AAD9LRP3_9STRA|nr:6-phosphogluconolactonase [Phytophthora citrophthora]
MHLPSFFLYLSALLGVAAPLSQVGSTQPILFAATSTSDPAKGVYTYKFNSTDGSLTQWGVTSLTFASGALNPTYLQESTKKYDGKPLIYALNRATGVGYVSAMTLNANGTLDLLNSQVMLGGSPAHVTLSPNEDFVAVANYAGSLSLFPLYENGTVAPESFYQAFPNGSRVVMDQQATGHIHSTRWLPNSNHVVAADLGGDTLLQYELDVQGQTLKSLETVYRPPGSGPRHSVLSTNGNYLYVTNEISNAVGVYKVNPQTALLESPAIQNITTLPENYTTPSTAADIHLSKNGKFVYVSNRGHNSIAIYAINEADGTLSPLGWENTRGTTPRGFTVHQDWLIVANQVSDDMYVFRIDEQTGLLSYSGNSYVIDGAVCLYVSEYAI